MSTHTGPQGMKKTLAVSTVLRETAVRNAARLIVSLILAGAIKYGLTIDEETENSIFLVAVFLMNTLFAIVQRWKIPLKTDAVGVGRVDVVVEADGTVKKV